MEHISNNTSKAIYTRLPASIRRIIADFCNNNYNINENAHKAITTKLKKIDINPLSIVFTAVFLFFK